MALAGPLGRAAAQPPPPPPARPPAAAAEPGRLPPLPEAGAAARAEGDPTPLPAFSDAESSLPEIPARPARRPAEVRSFIESLGTNDAAFEVLVNQARILTTQGDITAGGREPILGVGDPTVIEATILNARQLRILGRRVGVTDLSITTGAGQTYSFEVRVVADLLPLRAELRAKFPDASVRIEQFRNTVVVEGQARNNLQVAQILQAINGYLDAIAIGQAQQITASAFRPQADGGGGGPAAPPAPVPGTLPTAGVAPDGLPPPPGTVAPGAGVAGPGGGGVGAPGVALPEAAPPSSLQATVAPFQVINLLRVPGTQQVLLKVRIAELNRTALRRIGADFLGVDPSTGAIVGTNVGGSTSGAGSILGTRAGGALTGQAALASGANTTLFGIFPDGNFEFTLQALRRNAFVRILAEPNLVAMSGHQASFLAGGEFPVPVPQVSGAGAAPTITVRFREFGVRLGFVPYIVDDDLIRLSVAPEVSQIDFSLATTLVAGGSPIPGLSTRKAQTTVELRQGQTLAIAGLLQLTLDGNTSRIPGLGDLPILGPFFSATNGSRTEKELVVLVTPYLVEPMDRGRVPPGPGDEVKEPNDLEFYFLNRIESRVGTDFRSTVQWDDPLQIYRRLKLEEKYVHGPAGFSK